MIVGILKEPSHDARVSLLPEAVIQLTKLGLELWVEKEAGIRAFAADDTYSEAGAILKSLSEILSHADILLSINCPEMLESIRQGVSLIGVYQPLTNQDIVRKGIARKFSIFSLDMLPRTTRAQTMDVLSSQANIAGYKAVLQAAYLYPRYFPMFMTAAGSIAPAKVLVIGAGVAGLQAIATARRLGAVVSGYDIRPAAREQVESLGARFVVLDLEASASEDKSGYAKAMGEDF